MKQIESQVEMPSITTSDMPFRDLEFAIDSVQRTDDQKLRIAVSG